MSRTLINLPRSKKAINKFKNSFPSASFYGATFLGSGRKSYLIPTSEVDKVKLKLIGATISRDQPFI